MLAATAAVAAGCETVDQATFSQRPRPDWQGSTGSYRSARLSPSYTPALKPIKKRPKTTNIIKIKPTQKFKQVGLVSVLSRSQWTTKGPNIRKINKMGKITRITLHHSGIKVFTDKSYRGAQLYLEKIRKSHTRGWSDIGYHYAIDPNGRIWECRSIKYQGAHVASNNENNIGVLLMGNFELQQPSKQQLASMRAFVRQLRLKHKITVKNKSRKYGIKTHRELNRTLCPGKHLQKFVTQYRNNGYFA